MKKIVYNNCFGGFGLSALATKRYAELAGRECYFFIDAPDSDFRSRKYISVDVEKADKAFIWYAFDVPDAKRFLEHDWNELSDAERKARNEEYANHHIYCRDIKRDDPLLVQVVEELGEKSWGKCAELKIATVPVGSRYRIDEYDGNEQVMTADDYEWETA